MNASLSSVGNHDFDSRSGDEVEMPRGVVGGQRRGWKGDELEMNHQKEVFRSGKGDSVVAVDIRQFQNTVVGEGYQARHVVRQPSANPQTAMNVRDMTRNSSGHQPAEKQKRKDDGKRNYIENDGLREFRKEIELILSTP